MAAALEASLPERLATQDEVGAFVSGIFPVEKKADEENATDWHAQFGKPARVRGASGPRGLAVAGGAARGFGSGPLPPWRRRASPPSPSVSSATVPAVLPSVGSRVSADPAPNTNAVEPPPSSAASQPQEALHATPSSSKRPHVALA